MLLFRERPDEVLHDIVREALASLAENLKPAETDPRLMATLLPKTAKMLNAGAALATVDELIPALESHEMFELAPMHRLVLSEALKHYCESYNDQPEATELHARYQIRQLDCARMIDMFLRPFDEAFQEGPGSGPHGSAAALNSCRCVVTPTHAPRSVSVVRAGSRLPRPATRNVNHHLLCGSKERPYHVLSKSMHQRDFRDKAGAQQSASHTRRRTASDDA